MMKKYKVFLPIIEKELEFTEETYRNMREIVLTALDTNDRILAKQINLGENIYILCPVSKFQEAASE